MWLESLPPQPHTRTHRGECQRQWAQHLAPGWLRYNEKVWMTVCVLLLPLLHSPSLSRALTVGFGWQSTLLIPRWWWINAAIWRFWCVWSVFGLPGETHLQPQLEKRHSKDALVEMLKPFRLDIGRFGLQASCLEESWHDLLDTIPTEMHGGVGCFYWLGWRDWDRYT